MKHIEPFSEQKEIAILGRKFFVPEKMKYWAVDRDGELTVFEWPPKDKFSYWAEVMGLSASIGYVDLEDTDWRDTLTELGQ